MSILIPGMEMPKNCLECPLCWEDEEGMNCCFTNVVCLNIGRQAACPLIELPPHGDLVERDVVRKCVSKSIVKGIRQWLLARPKR
jgi:hypothetical protein